MSTPRVDALAKELSPMIDTMTADNAMEYIRVSMHAFCALASQLETELAAMTTERDSAFALLKTERDAFANMLAKRDAEREKVAKLEHIIQRASTKFCEDGPDGVIAAEMFRILGEKALESTK